MTLSRTKKDALAIPTDTISKSAPTTPQPSPRPDAKQAHHQHTQSTMTEPAATQEKSAPTTTFKEFLTDLMKSVRFAFYEAKTKKPQKTEIEKVLALEGKIKDYPNNDFAIQAAIEDLTKILDDAMKPTFGWKRTPEQFTTYLNEKMENGRHFPRLLALVVNQIAKNYLSESEIAQRNLGWTKNVKQPEMYLKHFKQNIQQEYSMKK